MLFPRQIGRASFFARYILFLISVWAAGMLAVAGVRMHPGLLGLLVQILSLAALLITLFYFIRHGVTARLKDIGTHSLFALLTFVPIVNLVFLVVLALVPTNHFKKS